MKKKRMNMLWTISLIAAILVEIFWGIWYLIDGRIPVIRSPLSISRLWDVPLAFIWTFILGSLIMSDKIKDNKNLTVGLSTGLVVGMIRGLTVGLPFGLVADLTVGLVFGLVLGLVFSLNISLGAVLGIGLGFGLVIGLIVGFGFSLSAVLGLSAGLVIKNNFFRKG